MKRKLAALTVSSLLAGCSDVALTFRQNEVDSVQQSGETHIALLAVEPWSDVVKDISPDFALTPGAALEAALPRVSAFEEKLLDVFAAKIGLGLPTSTETSTLTSSFSSQRTRSDDAPPTSSSENSRSGERTINEAPGELPGADVIPSIGDRSAAALPGLSETTRNAVLERSDPMLRYQAANAIYQYVQVLQRLVRTTPEYDGFTPYLATFQITSVPYARHQPYDLYLNFSFFPKVKDFPAIGDAPAPRLHFDKLPIVIPVLITDNVEGQSVSRAAELIRQFSLAAQGITGGVAAALGINTLSDRSAAVFGTDLTSTFTVGRTAQNGMTAILGAPRNPVSDYAMVRRTHNVSLLIMVPDEIAKAKKNFLSPDGSVTVQFDDQPKSEELTHNFCSKSQNFVAHCIERRLQVFFNTELRRPDKPGTVLPLQSPSDPNSLKRAQKFIDENRLDIRLNSNCEAESFYRELILTVPQADYGRFIAEFSKCATDTRYAEFLYHGLIDVAANSPGARTTTIVLPEIKRPTTDDRLFTIADSTAPIAAFDNGVNEMVVEAAGVVGTLEKGTVAVLNLKTASGARIPMVAEEVGVKNGKLVAKFLSPKALGVDSAAVKGGELILRYPDPEKSSEREVVWKKRSFKRVVYAVQLAKKTDAKPSAQNMTVDVQPDGSVMIKMPAAEKPKATSSSTGKS